VTRVAFLWHMHQPYYEDLVTREHILPWVRLHALKDYFGMVALLGEFPSIRMTFNLVPSLLVQLEAFAEDRAHDRSLALSLKPAVDLDPEEVDFILRNFFHAQRQRMIDVHPRYAELLTLRGEQLEALALQAAVRRFTVEDLRDLQVWHKLAWIDPSYQEGDSRIRRLILQGMGFTEDDKTLLRTVELEILNRVIPEYRDAAARGQIEISTSPFYHPILPLLCDSDVYKRTHPDSPMPRHRFRRPEDATDQLIRAVRLHERLFGHRPVGLWPSEGSVSDDMVPLVAAAGFEWMATDELILSRSLGVDFRRDGQGLLDFPERLYAVYQVGSTAVRCAFRDHALSDLIGFVYAGWHSDDAAEDFVRRLADAGRHYVARGGTGEPTLFVILDGENAWEHFEAGGRPFLRALYRRLSNHPELRTVTMAEACRSPAIELPRIFPGSWIDANFYIWIGHADDRRAWSQLAEAGASLDAADGVDPEALARAREEIHIAEGSDWFWWYGDDHSSAHDAEFDDLFRRHLRNAYRLMQRPIPDELFATNISTDPRVLDITMPIGLVHPTLDGEDTSYFEWLEAGRIEIKDVAGAMHRAEPAQGLLSEVRFGFDTEFLFLRIGGVRPLRDILAEGYEVAVLFTRPEGARFLVREVDGVVRGTPALAAGAVLEMAIPLEAFGGVTEVAFFVGVNDAGGVEIERHPSRYPIEVRLGNGRFVAANWTA
jgi:alpha-amylase/alpha-mannosidase (GH57 family)